MKNFKIKGVNVLTHLGTCLIFSVFAMVLPVASAADDTADAVVAVTAGTNAQNDPGNAVDDNNGTFRSVGDDGGNITVAFTDNFAMADGTAAADLQVEDRCGCVETTDVSASADGVTFFPLVVTKGACNLAINRALLTADLDAVGLGGAITVFVGDDASVSDAADGCAGGDLTFGGVDVEEVRALNSVSFGTADIEKTLENVGELGDGTIDVGIDSAQTGQFTITVTNNGNENLTDFFLVDVVPAEFDVAGVASSDDTACPVSTEENKRGGNTGLAPDFITIGPLDALGDGESCTITVDVSTDNDHPGRGRNPEFTPTSCESGAIVLNEGVQVFTDDNSDGTPDTLRFVDDDSIELDCNE